MSGITPILDTLLHQVLGRRGGLVRRSPNPPVRPPEGGQSPQPGRSDSRLDPRPLPASVKRSGAGATSTYSSISSAPVTTLPATTKAAATPATATHFSAAARAIADILARFPAPPSAIRSLAPLLAASDLDAVQLARLLRESIQGSGLFYESHLRRWRSGRYPLARLAREAQMRPSGPTPPGVGPEGVRPQPSPHSPQGSQKTTAALNTLALHLGLEGVLRHQLELLATPVLRWEGEPWAGLFMTLALYSGPTPLGPTPVGSDQDQERQGQEPDGEEGGPWQSQLTVFLPRLGDVTLKLALEQRQVVLDISAEAAAARQLEEGAEALLARLDERGFHPVTVRVHARNKTEEAPRG